MDGRVDLKRTAEVIRSLSPDLVTLQEVDKNCTRSGSIDLTEELAGILKMEGRFGKFMNFQGGEYGMAVLSKFPIISHQVHVLPRGAEPRCALEVRVNSGKDWEVNSFVRHSSRLDERRPEGLSVQSPSEEDREGNGSGYLSR